MKLNAPLGVLCVTSWLCAQAAHGHAQVPDGGVDAELPSPAGEPSVTATDEPTSVDPPAQRVLRLEVRLNPAGDADVRVIPDDAGSSVPTPPVSPAPIAAPTPVAAPEPPAANDAPDLQTEPALKITPEVQIRLREELFAHPYTGTPGSYSLRTHYRARGGATFEHAAVTIRLQVQAIGVFGDGLSPTSPEPALGLHQGYFQLTGGTSWLRVGRQEMAYGEGRMIGSLDWMMSARNFDAIRGHAESGSWTVDAFSAVTRAQADYRDATCVRDNGGAESACDVSHGSGDYLAGVYSTWTKNETLALDVYALFRHDGANASDVRRDRNIASPGIRATGELRDLIHYKTEAIVQLGQTEGSTAPARQHRAAAVLGEVGAELDREGKVILALGGAYATGQTKNGATEFDNFFPANHKIYGVADLFGLRNLQQEYASLHWSAPEHKLQGFFMAHALGLATAQGRWSNAPGNNITNDPVVPGSGRFLGTSWDAVIRYTPSTHVWIEAGHSLFAPTDNAARFGKTDAQHFAYLWTEAKLP